MAIELGEIECVAHGVQPVLEHVTVQFSRVVKLACGCSVTFDCPQIGDAVLFEGELFRVEWVGPGPSFDELLLANNDTKFYTESYSVTYVAKDALSPKKRTQRDSYEFHMDGSSRYFPRNQYREPFDHKSRAPEPAPKRKRTSISTADLIKDEVKALKTQAKTGAPPAQPIAVRQPVGDLAEAVDEVQRENHSPTVGDEDDGIPQRQGDW